MKRLYFYSSKFLLIILFSSLISYFVLKYFAPILSATSLIFPYAVTPFDICNKLPIFWKHLKLFYIFSVCYLSFIFFNNIFSSFIFRKFKKSVKSSSYSSSSTHLSLYVGNSFETSSKLFIPEKGLYQNILITGTIGSGKTSSAMLPFTKQLINYDCQDESKKFGMLILDVKGNFFKEVVEFARQCNRLDDIITIEVGGHFKYNPLDKPNLSPIVLANRLKTILTLFSSNNSDSYWLDKVEQALAESIKLCRLYNNNYVTFNELHNLINSPEYYKSKLSYLRTLFQEGNLSTNQIYDLNSSISFFEKELFSLDSRVLSILKSEITRITNTFISSYDIYNTFCPSKECINFNGFAEVLEKGKIVVLNMNIAEYKNLSKMLATYLKLDFQTEIMLQLTNPSSIRTSCFICDEFHEYVTSTDADFFSQSREAKSINIVATQSYTSLLDSLNNQATVKVIIQNLINKLWFRTDDSFTIEDIQKQIGKEDKIKTSKTISENAHETYFNYLTNSLNSKNSSVSESINSYIQSDFTYDSRFFTQDLKTFECLAFLSDGSQIIKPEKLKLEPYFKDITKKKKIGII